MVKYTVNRDELSDILESLTETNKEVTIKARTNVNLMPGGPYRNVTKEATVRVKLNYSYRNEVNKQRLAEGRDPDFVPAESAWGEHVQNTPLVEHNGNTYLDCMVLESLDHCYSRDGFPVSAADVTPFLRPRRDGRQDVDNPVLVRRYSVANLTGVIVGDLEYAVE